MKYITISFHNLIYTTFKTITRIKLVFLAMTVHRYEIRININELIEKEFHVATYFIQIIA